MSQPRRNKRLIITRKEYDQFCDELWHRLDAEQSQHPKYPSDMIYAVAKASEGFAEAVKAANATMFEGHSTIWVANGFRDAFIQLVRGYFMAWKMSDFQFKNGKNMIHENGSVGEKVFEDRE